MNCLCCGQPLDEKKAINHWHERCVKSFFGTSEIPQIELNDHTLELLALESTGKGYTVPGVQKKISLHLSTIQSPKLTLVNFPTGYILKPQVQEFQALPEAEQLVMCMADFAGITTVPHALVEVQGQYAYITKRVDRIFQKDSSVQMLAMEDFCQLDLRLTQDKYRGSYERCSKIIAKYSSRQWIDQTELFMRLVFSYLVGNSDMHLKNFSMLETCQASGEYVLAPAYDLLPVNVIMPEDQEQLALALNGKKTNIRKKDFFIFADASGLSRTAAHKMLEKLLSMQQQWTGLCENSLLPEKMKEDLINLIKNRANILSS